MKYLVVVIMLGSSTAIAQAESSTPWQLMDERMNTFQSVLSLCESDPALAEATVNLSSKVGDLQTIIATAMGLADGDRLRISALEPYGPVRTITVPHPDHPVTKTIQDQWKFSLAYSPGPARLDDGLASHEHFTKLDQALRQFEGALLAEHLMLEQQSWKEPTGGGTLLLFYQAVHQLRAEASLAFVVITAATHPETQAALVIDDAGVTTILDIIDRYPIRLASDFRNPFPRSSDVSAKK